MRTVSLVTSTLVLASALVGCGGGEPAKAPEQSPAAASEPKSEAMADSKPSHKPAKGIIEDPDLSFQYSFRDSDIREKKEAACIRQSKDDREKNAACMSKAQSEFENEYLYFDQVDGEPQYVVFRNPGHTELHRMKYSIVKESHDRITIKLIPPDKVKGTKRALPNEITFDIIDDSTISTTDPQQGKKVYRGTAGLVSRTTTTKTMVDVPEARPGKKK